MDHFKIRRFIEIIERCFPTVAEKFGREGDTGGFVYVGKIIPTDSGNQIRQHYHSVIREPDPVKWDKFVYFSKEKPTRLAANDNHVLSAESRDDDAEKYAGAVKGPHGMIYAFSGLPQEIDEAFVLAAMYLAGIVGDAYTLKCMGLSNNVENFNGVLEVMQKAA